MGDTVLPRSEDLLVLRKNRASSCPLKYLLYVDSFNFFMAKHMYYFKGLQKTRPLQRGICCNVFVAKEQCFNLTFLGT